ncbi:MAG TPA: Kiwa anti-phage protein KwaB-like domain-containing protein [Gemmatimonadales bacterium]|nr:Kiwa anti-phage protein KwaB-like domain-containing protein [Gemmatimonadales bacterium]
MKLNFDRENVTVTEFGVGLDEGDGQTFVSIPVGVDVQAALREMVASTWESMQRDDGGPTQYEPSEKHGGTEYLYLPLKDDLAKSMRDLHDAANLPRNARALADPGAVFCYFARMTDNKGRRLTALRRATQFKGILKSKGRLVRMIDDSLRVVEDTVFKLDTDFDVLVDAANVHILRPSAFEFAGNLQDAVLAAVPQNIGAVQKDLPFVDFAGIEEYAGKHPRAARYLASIRSQKETKNIDRTALRALCKTNGVEVQVRNGKVTVADGHEMDFLEVLDRRRYQLELVKGSPERFRAGSRQRIEN